ncbi:MAG: hypothetical protein JXA97_05650 [Anaerolineales bacterium]|nr:hypothetical protein [Anaerolineales bacterium]
MALRRLSAYNAFMRIQRERIWALGLSAGVSLLTVVPYLLANRAAVPNVFSGFLINPIDGFSYLAKMRQGAAGSWYFTLPYAAQAGEGVLLYLYYLLLGQLSTLFHVPLMMMFHAARVLASTAMFYLASLFYDAVLHRKSWAWAAFLITLFGAGLGWIGILIGVEGSDLSIPESIPLISAYTNAHFPVAAAAILGAALACLRTYKKQGIEFLHGWTAGTVLVIVLPFCILSIGAALGLWLAYDVYAKRRYFRNQPFGIFRVPGLTGFVGFIVGALPWLLYNVWVVQTHPVISEWTAQNQTPSPAPWSFLLGYGLLLAFAAAAFLKAFPFSGRETRFAAIWLISNLILLYAPFPLQRRLSLGLFFPLASLAVLGMAASITRSRIRLALLAVITLTLPSTALIAAAGIYGVSEGEPEVVFSRDELAALNWLGDNLPAGSLILAGPLDGNRIPAFSPGRVLYGHPFETPDAARMEAVVQSMFDPDLARDALLERLLNFDVDYVFEGPEERQLGDVAWEGLAEVVYANETITIYQVTHDG